MTIINFILNEKGMFFFANMILLSTILFSNNIKIKFDNFEKNLSNIDNIFYIVDKEALHNNFFKKNNDLTDENINFLKDKKTLSILSNKNKKIFLYYDAKLDQIQTRKLGAKILSYANNFLISNINISTVYAKDFDLHHLLYEGLAQKFYSFNHYITDQKRISDFSKVESITFDIKFDTKKMSEKFNESSLRINSIYLLKDLINHPANVLYPDSFVKIAEMKLKKFKNIKLKIVDEKELAKINANLILAVGNGSSKPPRMLIIEYHGKKKTKSNNIDIGLVGKGITFDSGGLSLKPAKSMEDMKGDMAGAATVLSEMLLLAERGANVNAVGILALAENMTGSNATRPGDIVKSMSGQTVEILNTDAEGRLVLADALYYLQTNYNPTQIIDLATLTGAVIVALGSEYAGIFSNNDVMARKIYEIGMQNGDKCWQFPMSEEYNKLMDSKIADMRNISTKSGEASSITAAEFLKRFIVENKSWTHIDIAGVSDIGSADEINNVGGTGFGLRLLDDYIKKEFE